MNSSDLDPGPDRVPSHDDFRLVASRNVMNRRHFRRAVHVSAATRGHPVAASAANAAAPARKWPPRTCLLVLPLIIKDNPVLAG
jgi:hypothetical protein